jgi:hypothetical protein
MLSRLARRWHGVPVSPIRNPRRVRPRVEYLEDRWVPAFMLRLEDGVAPALTVTDGGLGDSNPTAGVISFIGSYGAFDLNVSTALTKPLVGGPFSAEFDLNTLNISSITGGELTITAADTDYTTPPFVSNPLTMTSDIGGTLAGGTVQFQSWANAANLSPLATGTTTIPPGSTTPGVLGPFVTTPYTGTASTTFNRGPGPFSMFIQGTIDVAAGGQAAFDAFTKIVGEPPPPVAALGDFVWHDLNADGVQDKGEPGIAKVAVELRDAAGTTVLATTATDANGKYLFSGLTPGTYSVRFDQPAGFVPTAKDQGGNDDLDSDADTVTGKTGTYTLAPGETNLSVDAGFYKLAALGDFVWHDLNADGDQDAGEPGISGVTV